MWSPEMTKLLAQVEHDLAEAEADLAELERQRKADYILGLSGGFSLGLLFAGLSALFYGVL